jgi:hypothetical protein
VGFDPADPPRAVKFLDGDAVNEVALVETWTPGTHMLTYTAIGTAPSNGSHVRFGPPEPAIGDKTGYKLAADGLDLVVIEIGINARQALSPILAASAGVLSGSGSPSILIKAASNPATTRITASVDGEGNRSAVTLNLPS